MPRSYKLVKMFAATFLTSFSLSLANSNKELYRALIEAEPILEIISQKVLLTALRSFSRRV